jgi:hypothetical protein
MKPKKPSLKGQKHYGYLGHFAQDKYIQQGHNDTDWRDSDSEMKRFSGMTANEKNALELRDKADKELISKSNRKEISDERDNQMQNREIRKEIMKSDPNGKDAMGFRLRYGYLGNTRSAATLEEKLRSTDPSPSRGDRGGARVKKNK